jgi:hypothetical protein
MASSTSSLYCCHFGCCPTRILISPGIITDGGTRLDDVSLAWMLLQANLCQLQKNVRAPLVLCWYNACEKHLLDSASLMLAV